MTEKVRGFLDLFLPSNDFFRFGPKFSLERRFGQKRTKPFFLWSEVNESVRGEKVYSQQDDDARRIHMRSLSLSLSLSLTLSLSLAWAHTLSLAHALSLSPTLTHSLSLSLSLSDSLSLSLSHMYVRIFSICPLWKNDSWKFFSPHRVLGTFKEILQGAKLVIQKWSHPKQLLVLTRTFWQ